MCSRFFFGYLIDWNGMHVLFKCIQCVENLRSDFPLVRYKQKYMRKKTHFEAVKNSIKFQCVQRHMIPYIFSQNLLHFRHFFHSTALKEDYKSWYWNGNISHICAIILNAPYEQSYKINFMLEKFFFYLFFDFHFLWMFNMKSLFFFW